MSDISLREIKELEKVFLGLIDFDLVIRGSEYAKYYFILKTFANQFNSQLPMQPLSVDKMLNVQRNVTKFEEELKKESKDHLNRSMKWI